MDQQTLIEVSSAVDAACTRAAAKEHQNYEDAFLGGKLGSEYLGLHRYPESVKEGIYRWYQPPVVGNTDPKKIVPHGLHNWSAGDPGLFSCKGAPNQEDNFYVYMLLPNGPLPRRIFDFRTHQITDPSQWQALEWQSQITVGGKTHNMAVQAEMIDKVWRFFDYTNKKWIAFPAGMPFPDFTKPVQTITEFGLDSSSTTHIALYINGTRYVLNVAQSATITTGSDKATVAFQIDPKKGAVCDLAIAQIDLRMV